MYTDTAESVSSPPNIPPADSGPSDAGVDSSLPPPEEDVERFTNPDNSSSASGFTEGTEQDVQNATNRVVQQQLNDQPGPVSDPQADTAGTVGENLIDSTRERVAGAIDTFNDVLDPDQAIADLNSDGDRAVLGLTLETKTTVPLPHVPPGTGLKTQNGYQVVVEQVGDSQTPGVVDDANVQYEVTFGKNLLGGVFNKQELVPGSVDGTLEANLYTADEVTMSFETREEAAEAVRILQQVALEDSIRTAGSVANPTTSPGDVAANPLVEDPNASGANGPLPDGSGPLGLPGPADIIADQVAPSEADRAFLQDHITSYTTRVGAHERASVGASFQRLGIEPRFDLRQEMVRTVELPQGDEPGRLTYTVAGEFDVNSKQKLKAAELQLPGGAGKVGYTPQNIADHANVTGEISLSWELTGDPTTSPIDGRPVPEVDLLRNGELGSPDQIAFQGQIEVAQPPFIDVERTDLERTTLEVSLDNPTENAAPVFNDLLSGDWEGALREMGPDFQVSATQETIERDGYKQQHEVGFSAARSTIGFKVSAIAEVGNDDVVARSTVAANGNQLADQLYGQQLVVVPRDGLNVRSAPGVQNDQVGTLYHGTFLRSNGNTQTDAQGMEWVEVQGRDVNGQDIQGWVASQYVEPHAEGAMGDTGRINPDLDEQNYQAHQVQPGDNLWDIAEQYDADFQDLVELNSDHLIDPSLVFAGDNVYIPGTGQPVQPSAPSESSSPSNPSDPSNPSTPSDESSSPTAPSDASPTDTTPTDPSSDSNSPPVTPTDPSSDSSSPSTASGSDSTPPSVPSEPPPQGSADDTEVAPAPTDPTRPSTDEILRDYQVINDPGGDPIIWEPSGFTGFVADLAGKGDLTIKCTPTEAAMLDDLGPFELRDMSVAAEKAYSESEERFAIPADIAAERRSEFPPGEAGDEAYALWVNNDGQRDAFRHAYWNAIMTDRMGVEFTEAFTTAHEGAPGNPADREAMDLYNNELGRRIAEENPNASDEELAQLVFDAIQNGEAIVIDANGDLAWSDQVPVWSHGQADDAPDPGGNPPPTVDTSS
ncbi:MAG: LysM peptidoglycan-binding domain-containing protein [Candidatus Competibacteraceae bacterium]|nr:LysM peptidoglycan-binding domain-containing protein [Candidatus Competibacteraceae bacterium]